MKKKLLHLLRTSKSYVLQEALSSTSGSATAELILSIPEEDRAKEIKDLDFEDVLPVERALGVHGALRQTHQIQDPAPRKTTHSVWDFYSSEFRL